MALLRQGVIMQHKTLILMKTMRNTMYLFSLLLHHQIHSQSYYTCNNPTVPQYTLQHSDHLITV